MIGAPCCGIFSCVGIVFLIILGVIVDKQPQFVHGIEHPDKSSKACFGGGAWMLCVCVCVSVGACVVCVCALDSSVLYIINPLATLSMYKYNHSGNLCGRACDLHLRL